jgi:hypothetical protein
MHRSPLMRRWTDCENDSVNRDAQLIEIKRRAGRKLNPSSFPWLWKWS